MSCPNACVVFGYGLLVLVSLALLGMTLTLDVTAMLQFRGHFRSSFVYYLVGSVCTFVTLLLLLLRISQLCVSRVPTSDNLPSLCSRPFPAPGRRLDLAMLVSVSVAVVCLAVGLASVRTEYSNTCGVVQEAGEDQPYAMYVSCMPAYSLLFSYSVAVLVLLAVSLAVLSCLSCPCCLAVSVDHEYGTRRESESRIAAAVATRLFEMSTRRPGYLRVLPGEAEGEGEHETLQHVDTAEGTAETTKAPSSPAPSSA